MRASFRAGFLGIGTLLIAACAADVDDVETASDSQALEVIGSWSNWVDRDEPSGNGDWETLPELITEGKVPPNCKAATQIEAKTLTNVDWKNTGETLIVEAQKGLICVAENQPDKACLDYQVRFFCPAQCAEWTPWLDRDNASGNGDWEHLSAHISEGNVPASCAAPIKVEAQTLAGADASTTGETLTIAPATGLICETDKQADGACLDYRVRFLCPATCPDGSGGAAGNGGAAGSGGTAGSAGKGGTGGSGGTVGGNGGSAGKGGAGGSGGTIGGNGGSAGKGGAGGSGGAIGGNGGSAGKGGAGGTAGNGGSSGSGNGGTGSGGANAGTGGTAGTAGSDARGGAAGTAGTGYAGETGNAGASGSFGEGGSAGSISEGGAAGSETAGASNNGGSAGTETNGTSGTAGSVTTTTGGSTSRGGSSGTAGASAGKAGHSDAPNGAAENVEDDGGCSCSVPGSTQVPKSGGAWLSAIGLAFAALRRRRRA